MAQEFYVDGIGNISIQGPVVTLSYVRTTSQGNKPEDNKDEEVVKITMTGQNLVKMTNILGSTLKRIAERNKKEIETRYPKVLRRVGGYNLDALLPGTLASRPGSIGNEKDINFRNKANDELSKIFYKDAAKRGRF